MRVTKKLLENRLKVLTDYHNLNLELDYQQYYGYRLTTLNGNVKFTINMSNVEMLAYINGMIDGLERVSKLKRKNANG